MYARRWPDSARDGQSGSRAGGPPVSAPPVFANKIGHCAATWWMVAPNAGLYQHPGRARYYAMTSRRTAGFSWRSRIDGSATQTSTSASGGHGTNRQCGGHWQRHRDIQGAQYVCRDGHDRIFCPARHERRIGSCPPAKPNHLSRRMRSQAIPPRNPFAIAREGSLFADLGTATKPCPQKENRHTGEHRAISRDRNSRTRGGIWRTTPNRRRQVFSRRNGTLPAPNADGITLAPDGSCTQPKTDVTTGVTNWSRL